MLYVVLDNIRSAFNVGSIFRTCDGAGVDKLFLCGMTAYPPNTKLEKTALGTITNIPWEHNPDTLQVVQNLRKQDFFIISAESIETAQNYHALAKLEHTNICLVLGHELIGVGEKILELSDIIVKIPMHGIKTSLNVSVSAGILIYQLLPS